MCNDFDYWVSDSDALAVCNTCGERVRSGSLVRLKELMDMHARGANKR